MKKISMLLSLIVAVAMLVMPMSVMAETTTAQVIQFANPTVYMNGEEVMTLDGLAAQFAYCEGSEVAQFIFDIFVGGENANSAMIQVDPNYDVVGYVGGMSNAYTFNAMEVIGMFTEAMATESGIDMDQLSSIIAMAETWTLPDDLGMVLEAHMADFTVTEAVPGSNANGVPMAYMTISGEAMPTLIDMARVIENDPLVCAVLQLIYPEMTSLGLYDSMSASNAGMYIEATIGSDETGNLTEVNAVITLTTAGETEAIINYALAMDSSDPENIKADQVITMTDDAGYEFVNQNIAMNITYSGLSMSLNQYAEGAVTTMDVLVDVNGINDVVSLNLNNDDMTIVSIVYNGSATQTGYGFNLTADVDDYGVKDTVVIAGDFGMTESSAHLNLSVDTKDDSDYAAGLALALAADVNAGVYSATLDSYDTYGAPVSIGLKFTQTAPADGAYLSGVLSLSMKDEYDEISAEADVHLLEVDVDTDSFYISPAAAVAVLTMDDAQLELATTEMDAALNAVGTAIMNTYPEFFGN